MAQEIARRAELVERMDKGRRRAFARCGDRARNRRRVAAGLDRRQQRRHRRLALALQHAVDRTLAMCDDGARGKRGAVPADADEHAGKARLRRLGQVDDLGHVCQIVAGKRHDIGPPALDRPEIRRGDPRPAGRSAAPHDRRAAPPGRPAPGPAARAGEIPWCRAEGRDGRLETAPDCPFVAAAGWSPSLGRT